MTRRHHWEDFEVEALKQMFPHFSAGEIAKAIGITEKAVHGKANALGLKKPIEWVAQRARERNQQPGHGGKATRFTKGQQPWNAGTAGTGLMKGNSGSARVEVEMTRITGQHSGSGFVPLAAPPSSPPAIQSNTTVTPVPGGRVISHRMGR